MRVNFVVWGTKERFVTCLVFSLYDLSQSGSPTNEYLHHFVASRNARASAAVGEMALVTLCRI